MKITLRSRLAVTTVVALAAAFACMAAPASAGPLDPVGGTVSDTLGGAGSATGGAVNDAVGNANDTVDNTVGQVNDTVGQTTGGANDTVNNTVGQVNDTVNQTTGGANDTVDQTTGGVNDTVNNTVGQVNDTVNQTTGGGTGGTVGNVTDTVTDLTTGVTNQVGQTVHNSFGNNGTGGTGSQLVDEVLGNEARRGDDLTSAGGTIQGRTNHGATGSIAGEGSTDSSVLGSVVDGFVGSRQVATTSPTGSPLRAHTPFWQAAADAATEAAKRLAFPALLLALVGAFLLLHGRVGRKDPKLALAPVEADHDALAFE